MGRRRIDAGIGAADQRLQAAGAAISEAQLELGFKVANAASEALRQQERMRVAQGHVAQQDKLLEMIRRRVAQEVSATADINLAQSRMLAGVNDANAAKQALRVALAQLEQRVGEPVRSVIGSSADETGLPDERESLLARTLDLSPRLKRLRSERQQAEATVRERRVVLSPAVLLRLENVQGAPLVGSAVGSTHRALLVLQWQTGAGLSAVCEVTQQFESDGAQWTDARLRLDVARRLQGTVAEVADSYFRQYVAGRKSWLDMMNSVREVEQAELASVDVRYEAQAAALRLESGSLR